MHEDNLDGALSAAQDGDEAGFAALFHTLQPAVRRYLWVMVGDAVDDVAQEAWLQAVRDLPRFRGDAVAFRIWLFRIARNRGVDYLRRAGRRLERPDDEALQERASVHDTVQEVFDGLDLAWALRVLASLPRHQAEALMLRVVAGLDVPQTAQVLGKRPGAVRLATMRGLRTLARHPEVLARQAARRSRPQAARLAGEPSWRLGR
ncbi:RNA polymerase sigma factor [Micromonospora sp. NPDC048930]|uniref:RNA polymerase sigma factor n=1 Tax=Micromonospora sp. NPDC048930 TaxID=3364261 RepID=UPI0037197199